MSEEEHQNFDTEQYNDLVRTIHTLFSSVEGKRALDGLEQRFLHSYFDARCPGEKALYQQGQASVIYDIKSMIRQFENNPNLS